MLSIKADSGQVGCVQSLDALACVELTCTAVSDRSDGVVHWKSGKFFARVFTRAVDLSKVHTGLGVIGMPIHS